MMLSVTEPNGNRDTATHMIAADGITGSDLPQCMLQGRETG